MVEALEAIRPQFGSELRTMLATPAPVLDETLGRFVNLISAERPLALVLDDFHRITNPAPACAYLVFGTSIAPATLVDRDSSDK
jgi:ATP/maltotriose-dependent transcriptional regulator MalT